MKKLELIYTDNNIEMRYFEDETDRYRSWVLPKSIINKLIPWWKNIKFKIKNFPIVKIRKTYEFRIDTGKYLYMNEFMNSSNCCIGSWDIPIILIEALLNMLEEGLFEKNI